MEARAQIGWIGLGSMGSRMAPNLVKNGYDVTGFDVDPERIAVAASHGIAAAPSLSTLAANSDAIVSMIPSDKAFLDVVRGLRESARPTACLIDMSTVSPDVSAQAAELLDAAISLTCVRRFPQHGARRGRHVEHPGFGTGADVPGLAAADQYVGKKIAYLGPNEEARIMKLVVNVIVAAINSSVAEALNLGRRSGLDWNAMIDVINDSAVASPYIASKVAKLKERDWSPAATIGVIAKDMDLALELGRKRGAFLPLTAVARQVLAAVEGRGQGQLDMSCVATFFE